MAVLKIFGSAGSEGIPVMFCNCKSCTGMKPRNRAGYALELGDTILWLGISPDIRRQLLSYGEVPDYFFVSHIHFDHIGGMNDLRQSLIVGETSDLIGRKISLLIPKHLYDYFESIKPFTNLMRESVEKAF